MKKNITIPIFGFLVFYLFINNLLVLNGTLPFFAPEEASLLAGKEMFYGATNGLANLPSTLTAMINFRWEDLFVLRMVSALILILTFLGFFVFGKKIFGKQAVWLTLLVLSTSILTVHAGKFSSGDVWLFAAQTLSALTLILYLKQPGWKWHIWHAILTFLGALTAPFGMLVFNVFLWGILFFVHPNGKRLKGLWLWGIMFLIVAGMRHNGTFHFETKDILFINFENTTILKYLGISVLGILPWFAFFPPAIWNMIKRLRQKEELAIITFAWLIAGLLCFSIAAQAVFAFLIAKQLTGFFDKNYPYGNLVKASGLIHLGAALFGGIFAMIWAWGEMKGVGFRAIMWLSMVYWVGCFVSFIGLYLKNKPAIIGGFSFAGLLAVFVFWVKVFPLY